MCGTPMCLQEWPTSGNSNCTAKKKVSQKGSGEFAVNVREWLPEQSRGNFRDQYVVSLVDGGEEGERNCREVGRAAIAGVLRTIHECRLTRDDADEFYAEAAQLVYM